MVATKKMKYERVLQKKRTRRAVLDAAVRLLERGEKPRLAAVAREAEVSRATIYRYFPSEDALLNEAALDHTVPDLTPLLEADGRDLEDQIAQFIGMFYDHAANNERSFRQYLRAALEPAKDGRPARGGRRAEVLATLLGSGDGGPEVTDGDKLRYALAALTGIESLIVMKDVCGLDAAHGREILEWASRTLVSACRSNPHES